MTDPISDMLIRIKNAQRAGHETVLIPHSQFKQDIAKVLEKEGWVEKTEKRGRKIKKFLEISVMATQLRCAYRFKTRIQIRFFMKYFLTICANNLKRPTDRDSMLYGVIVKHQ